MAAHLLTSVIIARELLRLLLEKTTRTSPGKHEIEEAFSSAWIEKGDLELSIDDFSLKYLVPMVEKIMLHIKGGALVQGVWELPPDMPSAVETFREVTLRVILCPVITEGKDFLRVDFAYEKKES